MLTALLATVVLAAPNKVNAVYIGHSLASDVPDMVKALAGETNFDFKEQFIPGSPLRYQWDAVSRSEKPGQDHYRDIYTEIITPQTDILVLIDSVPRGDQGSLDESVDYTAKFVEFARSKNPQVQVYWYTPWHDINSGTPEASEYDKHSPNRTLRWRPRLDADHKLWQTVVQRVNQKSIGAKPVKLISADLALARLNDQIEAGRVPGLSSIKDLFQDDIHIKPLGRYFVACVHYATIFNASPVGKPYEISNRWSQPYYEVPDWTGTTWPTPNPETVKSLQSIAWSSVQAQK